MNFTEKNVIFASYHLRESMSLSSKPCEALSEEAFGTLLSPDLRMLPRCGQNKFLCVMEEVNQPKCNPENTPQNVPQNTGQNASQTVIINQEAPRRSNSLGTAGFVLALLGLVFSWVPVLGWILWLLGLIFSFVGVFRQPKGLSIAGLVISCLGLILLIIILAAVGAAMATM